MRLYQHYGPSLIGFWHIVVGMLLLFYPEVDRVASLSAYSSAFEAWGFILAGTASLFAIAARDFGIRCLLLSGQQAMLILTAMGVIGTILAGHYPDGTSSPTITHAFLLADQGVYIVLAAIHALFFIRIE